jgi:hypothetical protein
VTVRPEDLRIAILLTGRVSRKIEAVEAEEGGGGIDNFKISNI